MAFLIKDFGQIATAPSGMSLWSYRTPDVATDIDTAGYFNAARTLLKVGDVIFTMTSIGGTAVFGINIVRQVDTTNVDIGNAVGLNANTD